MADQDANVPSREELHLKHVGGMGNWKEVARLLLADPEACKGVQRLDLGSKEELKAFHNSIKGCPSGAEGIISLIANKALSVFESDGFEPAKKSGKETQLETNDRTVGSADTRHAIMKVTVGAVSRYRDSWRKKNTPLRVVCFVFAALVVRAILDHHERKTTHVGTLLLGSVETYSDDEAATAACGGDKANKSAKPVGIGGLAKALALKKRAADEELAERWWKKHAVGKSSPQDTSSRTIFDDKHHNPTNASLATKGASDKKGTRDKKGAGDKEGANEKHFHERSHKGLQSAEMFLQKRVRHTSAPTEDPQAVANERDVLLNFIRSLMRKSDGEQAVEMHASIPVLEILKKHGIRVNVDINSLRGGIRRC